MENQWIEIFKTGTHAAADGRMATFTEADLDRIVKAYDPRKYEAPIVIGQPKNNTTAFGRVERLKREGGTLFFKARNVVPVFAEMVVGGFFEKRSITFSPDMMLRRIGFQEAKPLGIKDIMSDDLTDDGASYDI